jgi:ring-1,2-phenylacetyl-CoA epoxidase subunit PaaD
MEPGKSPARPATAPGPQVQRAWDLLESVTDPEIPVVSLREMGILRDIRATDHGLEVVITPTYSGCPAMAQIEDDVRALLAAHELPAQVLVQLAPAWTTDWLSDSACDKLRDYGIAPPTGQAAVGASKGGQVVRLANRRVADAGVSCPRCGSDNTTETSHFGSTACKALYRCLACLEPFDHFKPH